MSLATPIYVQDKIHPEKTWTGLPPQQQDPELNNGLRRLGWYFCLVLVFLRFTRLFDFIAKYGVPTSGILYLFMVPAGIIMVYTGGLRRAFSHRSTRFWLAFVFWMLLSTPFSSWLGGSAEIVVTYVRMELPMLLLLAGLPLTWKEWRMGLYAIALASSFNVLSVFLDAQTFGSGARIGLNNPTIGNPNDYAGHLLFVLPAGLFFLFHPPQLILGLLVGRILMIATLFYGVYLILASGSRGAFLALVAVALLALWKATLRVRFALIFALPVVAGILLLVVPQSTLSRLFSYSTDVGVNSDEASLSASLRRQLFIDSVMMSTHHPLLGVGPGEFSNNKGDGAKVTNWVNAHNSYTQISADIGFPGFIFYMAGILAPFFLLQKLWKRIRRGGLPNEMSTACFCLSVSWVGFCVAITFLNFGYFFYLPAFAGMIGSLQLALGHYQQEIYAPQPAASAVPSKPAHGLSPPPTPASGRPENRIRFNGYRRS